MSKKLNIKQIERLLMLVLGVFAAFFLLRQCLANEQGNESMMKPIATEEAQPATPIENPPVTNPPPTTVKTIRDTIVQTVTKPTPLFIWVDQLKLRSEPSLSGAVLDELALNTQVVFQNETSTFKQKITIENVEHDERWLKVKTANGKIGWVYGGGVRLYQK